MKCYEIKEGGATYWVAADDIAGAVKAWLQGAIQDGEPIEDTIDGLSSIEEMTQRDIAEKSIVRDHAGRKLEPMAEALARETEPSVLACSEWP